MKNYPTKLMLVASVFTLSSALAFAQDQDAQKSSPPTGNTDSASHETNRINKQDTDTGNNLSANKSMSHGDSDAAKTQQIHGQKTDSGNNLMGNKKGVTGTSNFEKLDTGKTGRVTAAQAKKDPWLSRHFKQCDKDGDGAVSAEEYAACRSIK